VLTIPSVIPMVPGVLMYRSSSFYLNFVYSDRKQVVFSGCKGTKSI
jgi:uncharacterized membrane protein YjjB (DUF3815 family)